MQQPGEWVPPRIDEATQHPQIVWDKIIDKDYAIFHDFIIVWVCHSDDNLSPDLMSCTNIIDQTA